MMITCPFIRQVWLECVDAVRDAGGEDVGTCSSVVRDRLCVACLEYGSDGTQSLHCLDAPSLQLIVRFF